MKINDVTYIHEEAMSPIFVGDPDVARIDRAISSGAVGNKQSLKDLTTQVYTKYSTAIKDAREKFERTVSSMLKKYKDAKFLVDTKSMDSVLDKVVDRKRPLGQINDLVRGAVLFDSKKAADHFVKGLLRKYPDIVVDYDKKEKGQDPTYGYFGSHHLSLVIGGLITELQVMTKKLWQYKEPAHDIYAKTRSKPEGPDAFDRHMSKKMFSIANKKSESIEEESDPSNTGWEEVDISKYWD